MKYLLALLIYIAGLSLWPIAFLQEMKGAAYFAYLNTILPAHEEAQRIISREPDGD